MLLAMTACGTAKVDEEHSPVLTDLQLQSGSRNTEDSQYVTVDLVFDRAISVVDDKCSSLRITIAEERVQDDEYSLSQGEGDCTAQLTISVKAVTKGVLKIEKEKDDAVISEIRSADGAYAAQDFTVKAMIPSGVELSTVESGVGRVVKNVDSFWNIRSIAWVGLMENGHLIRVSETRPLEMLDGYAAVHGHEFLRENQRDIAKRITEVLQNNYGDEYQFSCDGTQVTAEKRNSDAELDLEIYSYRKINGKTLRQETARP